MTVFMCFDLVCSQRRLNHMQLYVAIASRAINETLLTSHLYGLLSKTLPKHSFSYILPSVTTVIAGA